MRAQFCTWALDVLEQDPEFFSNVLFRDEATFPSNECLNRHNCLLVTSESSLVSTNTLPASLDPSCLGGNMP